MCRDCNTWVDAQGRWFYPVIYQAEKVNIHRPGNLYYPPVDPNSCGGGYTVGYYYCLDCHEPVDAEGHLLDSDYLHSNRKSQSKSGHSPGKYHEPDPPCRDYGCRVAYYECKECGAYVDAQGNLLPLSRKTAPHTFGKHMEASYTPCAGGYGVVFSFYDGFSECSVCGEYYYSQEGLEKCPPSFSMPANDHTPVRQPDGSYRCSVCNAVIEAEDTGWVKGNFSDDDGVVDMKDAAYFIGWLSFPYLDLYPMNYSGDKDFDGDGVVDMKDAAYFIGWVSFPYLNLYPIDW